MASWQDPQRERVDLADPADRGIARAAQLRLVRPEGQGSAEPFPRLAEGGDCQVAVGGGAALRGVETAVMEGMRVVRLPLSEMDERDPLRLRALAMGVPYLHLPAELPRECRGLLGAELARELRAVPVGRSETALTVAFDVRWDARALFRLRAATGLEIFPVLTLSAELERALAQLA